MPPTGFEVGTRTIKDSWDLLTEFALMLSTFNLIPLMNKAVHLIPQKLEQLSLKEQRLIKSTSSTIELTPCSEGTHSEGVDDPTVSQHGLLHPK